jgi:RNA polymerase sigma factor (sigma-70 family)
MTNNKSERVRQLEKYESEIFGYIKNAVEDAEVAKDLCQDVLIQAYMKIDELDFEKGILNWLKVVSRNRIINFYRQRTRRIYTELTEDTLQTEMDSGDLEHIIEQSLHEMTALQREVFILREIKGYSYKEIAKHFGRSISAINSLVHRSKVRFIRHYLLQFLPGWIKNYEEELSLEDLVRFINVFDPPINLLNEIQHKSQQYFNAVKIKWNQIHTDLIPRAKFDEVIHILGNGEGKKVLDLGCGSGIISAHNASLGKKVISIDMNLMMLDELLKVKHVFNMNNLFPICANISRPPLKRIGFDEIFLTLVLHHIADPVAVIRQAADLLAKDGCMVIIEFERHINRQFADMMHDLWLGFDSTLVERWCANFGLHVFAENTWNTKDEIQVYYRIFKKNDN